MYKKTVLDNGLRVVTHKSRGHHSVALGFWIGVGGRYEEDRVKGIAHYLEHIVFKGSKKYTSEEIKMGVEGVGGSMNAFTSEEQTCFYAKIPSQYIDKTFDVLADMVRFPKIVSKDVGKEKTVILEEIKMYHDLPQYHVTELLEQLMWPDHPLGKGLTGSQTTVKRIFRKDLKRFHQLHYSPENIVVAACGNVSHEKIVRLAHKKLSTMGRRKVLDYQKISVSQASARAHFSPKNCEQMHLAFGIPGLDERHKDRYVVSLLSILLGGNMSSRLFVEVREKRGLAYSISSSFKALHDTGLFLIRAGVDNLKIVDAVKVILRELTKIKRNGVSLSEFKRGREYLCGQLQLGLEDTMEHMLWLGEGLVAKNELKSMKNMLNELEKIKPSDIKRVAEFIFNQNRYNLAVIGPVTAHQERELRKLLHMPEH